jgi:Ca2+-binding RTX toxin-like protein
LINGEDGNDTIDGGIGNDVLNGGAGRDLIYGGEGSDFIIGGDGNDTIDGGDESDTIDGGFGNDVLNGGAGNDVFFVSDLAGNDIYIGGAGSDLILVQSSNTTIGLSGDFGLANSIEEINGEGANGATVQGDGGNNILDFTSTVLNGVIVDGGIGNDLIIGNNQSAALLLGAAGNDTLRGGLSSDVLNGGVGNDSLDGGAGNDILDGGDGSDVLGGGDGNDTLTGGSGNDVIIGNAGDDFLDGGNGNDTLTGGNGKDSLTGGSGNDIFAFQFGQSSITSGIDRIVDFAAGDKIQLFSPFGVAALRPTSITRAADSSLASIGDLVNAVYIDANVGQPGNQALAVGAAALVVATTGAGIAGTYLIVDNGIAGYQSNQDLVINVTGYTGASNLLGITNVNQLFV